MPRHPIPTYKFEFRGGLSRTGCVDRICSGADGGRAQRISYRLDDLPFAGSLGWQMPELVADLIDVSAAISVSDRLALREPIGDPRPVHDRWHRRIHVVIPVRYPGRWRRPEVVACLRDLLAFLTDDQWTFEFVDRLHVPRQSEVQASFLQPPPRPVAVVLQSDGLDSLAGVIDRLSAINVATVMPVTIITNRRLQAVMQAIIGELGKSVSPAGPLLLPARLHVGIASSGRPRDDREPSHRARAMIFLAAGVAASVIADTDRLYVCENGIGAISLPMTPDHWGARTSKAMHPKTLALFARLASLVLDRPIEIQNIGLFATKGELVRTLGGDGFAAARRTVSCDRATYLGHGRACGKCTSCLLRRVALVAHGMEQLIDGQTITCEIDWFDPTVRWESGQAVHLVAMRDQVERLRAASKDESCFVRLEEAFPALFDVVAQAPSLGLTRGEVERGLVRLYRAYVREFDALVARIDRPGWGMKMAFSELTPAATIAVAG